MHTVLFTQHNKQLQETGFQYAETPSFDNRASPEQRVLIYIQKYFDKYKMK